LLAFNEGDYLDAERRFSARIQRNEGTGEGLFYLAMMAERLGRTDAALPGYEELVRAGAGLAPRSRAARLLVARGEAPKAMRLFDDWLRSGRGDFIDTELARARALSEGGMRAEALQGIDLALERHPEHPELRYQRAVELDGAGRSREAIKEFEALLKERPDDANVLNALGYTLADRKKSLRRAENLIRAALEQVAGIPVVTGFLARDARATLRQAIANLPERERHVILLYYARDLSLAEVGAVLEVTPSRVCQILTDARNRLRKALGRDLDVDLFSVEGAA
jgi:RNA polymerase sigma factor (sigma-70 family)